MEDLNLIEIQPYVFILVGVGLVLLAIFRKSNKGNLKITGLKTEGIVFSLGSNPDNTNSTSNTLNIKDKVTIRFITKNNEWITGDIKQDFAAFFANQYKEGETVDVYYDPENHSNFFVDTKQSELISRLLFAAVGMIVFSIGLYQLLSI